MIAPLLRSARQKLSAAIAPRPTFEAKHISVPQNNNIDFFTASFEAATRQGFRGYFWFPSLDPAVQMPSWSRETVMQKINWLYNNVGPVRAVIDGLSIDEVDTGIWPKATTSNPDFNRASTDRFHESWKDARFFDTRAVDNVYMSQLTVRRQIRLHGELFGQLIRPDATNPFVRLHYIPAWQVRNAGDDVPPNMSEGILSDLLGAPISYRCATGPNGEYRDVPAADMLHFHDSFWVGQKRGMAGLAPVARRLFNMKDIEDAVANGVQFRANIVYAIEKKEGDTGGPTLMPGVVATEKVPMPDGGELLVHKIVQRDNREFTVAEPPPGRTMKTLESQATTEPLGFKTDILTDVAYCSLYPPDYVFALAKGTLGTEVRWKVRRVQRIKNMIRQFQLIPQLIEPLYRFRTWQDIKRGLYDDIPAGVPLDWWRYKAICPADDSVDVGREGKLYDERFSTNRMSPGDYFGMQGHDGDDVDTENLELRGNREQKLSDWNAIQKKKGLPERTYEEIWPVATQVMANLGQIGPEPAAAPPAEDPDKEEEEDE